MLSRARQTDVDEDLGAEPWSTKAEDQTENDTYMKLVGIQRTSEKQLMSLTSKNLEDMKG